MRRGVLVFILVNVLIIAFLVRNVFTLLTLLIEDASQDAIHRADISSGDSPLLETRPQVIPKIIHQTYINESIPPQWVEPQQSCINLHPDYEYMVRYLPYYVCRYSLSILTVAALDERKVERVYRDRIPVVFGDIRWLRVPDPAG